MNEKLFGFSLFLFMCVGPVLIGLALGRYTRLSKRLAVCLASGVAPASVLVLAALAYTSAARASPEECGVDACGMVMAATFFAAIFAVVLLAVGLFLASIGFNSGRK